MSQAHRPTWNPTQGRETKSGSQQISKLSLAAHTKLKFRQSGQTSSSDVARRDLKAELLAAERAATDKKRKAQGLPALAPVPAPMEGQMRLEEDEAAVKRRRILEEAAEMDKDDESSDEETVQDKGKGKAEDDDDDDDEDASDSDSDDEDDTAALMAELAKIKQERAEEKARLDAEAATDASVSRESEIATGNPLLNLQAALGSTPSPAPGTPGSTTTSASTFKVARRWDDDLVFKNQSVGFDDKPKKGEFVNDLLRSDFHRKFMHRFIK